MKYYRTGEDREIHFNFKDLELINTCRGQHNKLGYAYQLAYVRVYNRFPVIGKDSDHSLLKGISDYLGISEIEFDKYNAKNVVSRHKNTIYEHFKYTLFSQSMARAIAQDILDSDFGTITVSGIQGEVKRIFTNKKILFPSQQQLDRFIRSVKDGVESLIYQEVLSTLDDATRFRLDYILTIDITGVSHLQYLKSVSKRTSVSNILDIQKRIQRIEDVGLNHDKYVFLNRNLRRFYYRKTLNIDAPNIAKRAEGSRYTLLVCFLLHKYQDLKDELWNSHNRLRRNKYNTSERKISKRTQQHKKMVDTRLDHHRKIVSTLYSSDADPAHVLAQARSYLSKEEAQTTIQELNDYFDDRFSDPMILTSESYHSFRKYTPAMLNTLTFRAENNDHHPVMKAVNHLRTINRLGKQLTASTTPLEFIPKIKRKLLFKEGKIVRARWEECLMGEIEKKVRDGELYIQGSTRYDALRTFFLPQSVWNTKREEYFQRNRLPTDKNQVNRYLRDLLHKEIDTFNTEYGSEGVSIIENNRLHVPKLTADILSSEENAQLNTIRGFIQKHSRIVSLIDVCIEINNELHFTRFFSQTKRKQTTQDICEIIAVLLAYATNTGLHTMARMTKIPYHRLRIVANRCDEDSLRQALNEIVKAMINTPLSHSWGSGISSSSDGQKFANSRKILQSVFSHKLRDYGTEFYSFVADNYTPFHSEVIECNERDALFIPSGLTSKGSEILNLEEHYTDTHGYAYVAFSFCFMRGIRFRPRIRDIHKQRLYCLSKDHDTGVLKDITKGQYVDIDNIVEHWDQIAHYFASIEYGDLAPNIGMKRIVNLNQSNKFYKAIKDLGKLLKTVHLLQYHRDPELRRRITKGLNKGELLHSLGRVLRYGKDGSLNQASLEELQNTCSALTLVEAIIIYWQTKEMEIIMSTFNQTDIDTSLISRLSPIEWNNILIYGEYTFDTTLIDIRKDD